MERAWCGHKDRQKDQWNWIKDPNINTHTYEHLIFDKEAKNFKMKKKTSSTNGAGITGFQHVEEEK